MKTQKVSSGFLAIFFKKDYTTYSSERVDQVKAKICDGALISIAVLSVPTLIGSLSRAFEVGLKPAMFIQAFLAMSIWVLYFVRKRLPYWFRATFLLCALYIFGATGLLQFGLLAAAGAWFIITPALTVILFNIKTGLTMTLVTFISFIVIAILNVKGFIIFDYNVSEYAASLHSWVNFSLTYLLGAVFLFVAVSVSTNNIMDAITETDYVAKELTRLLETASNPVFGIDTEGKINEWNQTSEKIMGFTKDEVLGKDLVQTFIAEDYRASVKKVLEDALLGKETTNFELSLFTKKGKGVILLFFASTRRDIAGKINGVLGRGQDITERVFQNKEREKRADELALANIELAFQNKEKDKRADELVIANEEKEKRADELALANIELAFQNKEKDKRAEELVIAEELKQFIQTANTPVFGIDNIGVINEWNQTSEKISGYKKEEVLGLNWLKLTPVNSEKDAKIVVKNALKGKQTSNFEFITRAKNGQKVILLVNTSTRRDAAGKITGVLGVGQDITELVGYRNDLELKVYQRTLKLNIALEKEKELNELKSQFVSTASHEFRTPLSAINFAAGSIKKHGDKMEPIKVAKKLDKIENQVLYMTQLLNDMLIVGQAEAGKIKNSPINVNLGNFIDEIIEEVYSSYKESHELLLIDPEELKNTDLFIDEKIGRNIFINLLSNAIKFSPDADKITIELSSEKDHTIISVTDYGIGIPKSEVKNIFTPFTRGKNVDLIQGTGLGLSIVKQAVDLMGGEIVMNSKVGKGTTFSVKILKQTNKYV
ncbi:MAG: PAS domain S-box-containing protein [Polaribacter sp.]|jgi:PAS domain S-box-containing protein